MMAKILRAVLVTFSSVGLSKVAGLSYYFGCTQTFLHRNVRIGNITHKHNKEGDQGGPCHRKVPNLTSEGPIQSMTDKSVGQL